MFARQLLVGGGSSFPSTAPFSEIIASGSRTAIRTGTSYKAFPGMCVDADGRWHVVYRSGSAHNSPDGSIDYITSDDLGVTWDPVGSADILYLAPGSDDARDPFIFKTASGRLLVGYDHRAPYNSNNITAYLIYSDDEGSTWGSEYQIPDTFSGPQAIVTSQPIQLAGGDILIPGFGTNSVGGNFEACVWRSEDDGATVSEQITVAEDGAGNWEELQIRQLASGDIIGLMRDTDGDVTYRTVSTDDGETWSAPTSVLTGGGRPDFVEIAPGLLFLILRANNSSNLAARWTYSTDDGGTWAALQEVDSGATQELMYSAPVVLSVGTVAVAYSLENSSSDADIYLRHYVAS